MSTIPVSRRRSARTVGRFLSTSLLVLGFGAVVARGTEPETWVEAVFRTCGDSEDLYTQRHNGDSGGAGGADLDGDGDLGGTEDSGTDEGVWSTIAGAVAGLTAGGTTHLPALGSYRESVNITQSMTLRGADVVNVVLEGGRGNCADPASWSAGLDIDMSSDDVVIVENLTIRGFASGIDLSGSSGGTLIVRNCRFDNDTYGITGDPDVEIIVMDSSFLGGSYGVISALSLSLSNTSFTGQTASGVSSEGAGSWDFDDVRVSGSGAVGILCDGGDTGTQRIHLQDCTVMACGDTGFRANGSILSVTVNRSAFTDNAEDGIRLEGKVDSVFAITDSVADRNADDGIFVENRQGCTSPTNWVSGAVTNTRLSLNGDDGIEIGGTGSGCGGSVEAPTRCGLINNVIVSNGDYGIVETAASSAFHCGVGLNVISYNISGAESGTGGVCSITSGGQNQVN